jgi:Carboxypeptidase regulatory-like domain
MRQSLAFPSTLTLLLIAALLPVSGHAQSFNGSIAGRVLDPSGAVVSGADLVLKNVNAGVEVSRKSNDAGEYAFRNLLPGTYELRATSAGFSAFRQKNVEVTMNSDVRVDITLPLGGQAEEVEVVGQSVLTYDTAAHVEGIAPNTLAQLPLAVTTGRPRSSAGFAILMPGVSTGGGANPFGARLNGGMQTGDEAVLDGASMQQGHMSQGGMISLFQDFPFSPDMVSEVKVMTSTYEPQYGGSTSGQIMATTRSGTDSFHGAVFEYHRNDALNATQYGAKKKAENKQNNFGVALGGPAKIPVLWSSSVKSYFYADFEGYRQTGGANTPTLSIPSLLERNGNFSDWRDASGNLIPIYDPATTRIVNGVVVRDPFPGNIIPSSRISPLAREWMQFLPNPTSIGPLNNYLVPIPVPDTIVADSNYYFLRFDTYAGEKDHLSITLWHQRSPAKFNSTLPHELANETYSDPQNSWVDRANWDHTFGPNLHNHMTFGYLNRNEGYGSVNADAVNTLPQIAGVAGHSIPPTIRFCGPTANDCPVGGGFASWGNNAGVNVGNITTRPTYVLNDLVTWIKGSHTIKSGFEYRNIGGNLHSNGNDAGTFSFGPGATGILGQNSGSPIASFLLGAVDNGNSDFRTIPNRYVRQAAYVVHAGDTWRVNTKLTVNYGLRWDLFTPSKEKYDQFSFFDPVGANPGAAGRPGRLAFAGDGYGSASYGARYPEKLYWKAFQPRLGATYAINTKTVVRAGWGIFYNKAFYPGWGGGIDQAGFNSNVAFSSTLGGLEPAFFLQDGFPQNFQAPPFIQSDYRNGQDILYRPLNANERARSQQWNITVDRQIARDFMVSLAYVGSRGTHLPSANAPLNALDPQLLSLGSQLNEQFQEGQTSLHGVPIPYAGWREQMTGCAPSLAQALLPFPQYCSRLQGLNEFEGKSLYNSLQAKAEKRFSGGTYLLVSYTLAKLKTSGSDTVQSGAIQWSGALGVISPYEKDRNYSLATDDVTHLLSVAMVYELPFGKNKKWVKSGVGAALLGGWQLSTLFRYSSGIPFFFRLTGSACNVPAQFRAGCIPALLPGANPFAQDKGSFDPAKGPLLDKNAFEPASAFNFYYGTGDRVSNVRGFGYHNQDLSLIKNTKLGGRINLQLRIEAFNVWNWHIFQAQGNVNYGLTAFNTDLTSPDFGKWNGTVSDPRNVQVAARIEF